MKKIQRQLALSTSQPPSTGPIAVVIAVNPDQVPIALPRAVSSAKLALIKARLVGVSRAPATPWAARAMIRVDESRARPHQIEVRVNSTVPMMKSRRRPNRSPSAPPTSTSAARPSA
jgi:hypothetical protein